MHIQGGGACTADRSEQPSGDVVEQAAKSALQAAEWVKTYAALDKVIAMAAAQLDVVRAKRQVGWLEQRSGDTLHTQPVRV